VEAVGESGVDEGMAIIYAPHATGAILINEDEPGLKQDMIDFVKRTFPRGKGYRHDRIDDNANSHLASAFVGSGKTVPIENGRLTLGTWQSIFFLETDGPRPQRRVIIKVI
jgi:secondary thiamine-phosphate synthase enzyme